MLVDRKNSVVTLGPGREVDASRIVKLQKMNALVVLASVISSLGGILFGYDIGIISAAMLHISVQFGLSSLMQEVVTSSVLLGAFLSSLVAGSFVDYFGRRASILFTSVLFLAGTAVLVFAVDLTMVLVGRIVVGFGVALSTAAECTYISEISPPRWRGLLVSLNEFGITIGFLLAYVFGYIFISYEDGWRYMFGVAAIPAIVQLLGVAFLPPSPHFLILKGKDEKAAETIERLYQNSDPYSVIAEIKFAIRESKSSKLSDIFSSLDGMRYRMMIGIALVLLQQFTGNSNILYYAPIIFQQFGFCSNSLSTLVSVSLGAVKVITAAIALALVDRYGRRSFLCSGATVMCVSILALGIVTTTNKPLTISPDETVVNIGPEIVVDPRALDLKLSNFSKHGTIALNESDSSTFSHPELTLALGSKLPNRSSADKNETLGSCGSGDDPIWIKVLSVIALMTYICGYQFSFGIGTWLVLSEIFPTAIRGRSVSIATSVYWASNLLITVSFFSLMECLGISILFIIYACLCLLAAVFIYIFVPETKQKTLEEISRDLTSGPRNIFPSNCCKRRTTSYDTDRTRITNSIKYASYQSNCDYSEASHM